MKQAAWAGSCSPTEPRNQPPYPAPSTASHKVLTSIATSRTIRHPKLIRMDTLTPQVVLRRQSLLLIACGCAEWNNNGRCRLAGTRPKNFGSRYLFLASRSGQRVPQKSPRTWPSNAPRTVPLIADAIEGYVNPGSPGTLTIASETRLREQEISTGVRPANQSGAALAQSAHIGEEFVDAAGKTYHV